MIGGNKARPESKLAVGQGALGEEEAPRINGQWSCRGGNKEINYKVGGKIARMGH